MSENLTYRDYREVVTAWAVGLAVLSVVSGYLTYTGEALRKGEKVNMSRGENALFAGTSLILWRSAPSCAPPAGRVK